MCVCVCVGVGVCEGVRVYVRMYVCLLSGLRIVFDLGSIEQLIISQGIHIPELEMLLLKGVNKIII